MDRDQRHHDDREGRGRSGGPDDRGARDGGGADTRFLQLEMSRVLYGEAEAVARPAFRELLLDAAKARLQERFGTQITRLAQLAVDELLTDMQASLDIEEQIQRRRDAGGTDDRVRDALAPNRPERAETSRAEPTGERRRGRAGGARPRRR